MKTYECSICLTINHASRVNCQCCGTIPKHYSMIGSPARFATDSEALNSWFSPVVIAKGADRAEHHRTVRSYLRTVKADYYATE